MSGFYVPTTGPNDWRRLLADPSKHWRRGYSAHATAHCWEDCGGFPREVKRALDSATEPALNNLELLLAIPEHQTPLLGGRRPSQSDIFVLAKGVGGVVSITVEGKVNEDFGPVFDEWYEHRSPGKAKRWDHIAGVLGLGGFTPHGVRYQLLHRLASAAIEAGRFGALHAVLLVHSFGDRKELVEDFDHFLSIWGQEAAPGQVVMLSDRGTIQLYAGWVRGNRRFLE